MPFLRLLLGVLLAGSSICLEMDERLEAFRKSMSAEGLQGYIVPNSDYHSSEIPMERDKIREWLTGFTGSHGDAALTMKEAALWTDSRYTVQAKLQVTNSWSVAGKDEKMEQWFSDKLLSGQLVGADPKRLPFKSWLSMEAKLNEKGIKLVPAKDYTELWDERPSFPSTSLFIHDIKYHGQSLKTKMERFQDSLQDKNCTIGVITAMSEIAWILNLRGGDVVHTPIFAAFLIVNGGQTILYVRSSIVTESVRVHLNSSEIPVTIKNYDDFWNDWEEVVASSKENVFVPNNANYFIYSAVPQERRKNGSSLVIDMRAYKTPTEVAATREAHIFDAIALVRLFKLLEKKIIADQQPLNEGDISNMAIRLRREVTNEYMGPSFHDIVASGTNGALPHYTFEPGHEASVNQSAVMYIDSGGQYLGGTTDVTRVLHFGKPRDFEIEVYTRLLKGVARLGGATFPEGYSMKNLDVLMREPMYEAGLDYGHGSTHGIGVFLSVHEDFNGTYYENFIGSQEPGYYEENNFGMRLENAVVVVPAETKYKNKVDKKFIKFSALTLVPYEPKLIDPNIMDDSEINWVNTYHREVQNVIGGRLLALDDKESYNWLVTKTKQIVKKGSKKK